LTAFNAGVRGLANRLVPIDALNVRVCRYGRNGRLVGSAALSPLVTAPFEHETNRLVTNRFGGGSCVSTPPVYFLTFAGDTQQVSVADEGECGGYVSNGVRGARTTAKWRNELQRYATASPVRPGGGCGGCIVPPSAG
jgi:hypothetical protein